MVKTLSTGSAFLWYDTVDPTLNETGILIYDFWVNTSTQVIFMVVDITPGAQIWKLIAPQENADWTSSSGLSEILNKPPARSQSLASRSLNSAFQISATRDCLVSYSVEITTSSTLVGGETGTVFLEIASDSGFTTDVQEICRIANGNSVALGISITFDATNTGTLSGYVPVAYYVRLRTDNTDGSPSFSYESGQEVLL